MIADKIGYMIQKNVSLQQAINALLKTLEAKDNGTHAHSQRVSEYCLMIAHEYSFTEEELREIELAGLLHDIGKIATPDHILKKKGKLTDEEFTVIKGHPIDSYEILSQIAPLKNVAIWVRAHQERVDGFGYPDRLKGEEIPLAARILCVADAFDAMTSDRPYRKALSLEEAYAELKRCAGTQFDQNVVQVFLEKHQAQQQQSSSFRARRAKNP